MEKRDCSQSVIICLVTSAPRLDGANMKAITNDVIAKESGEKLKITRVIELFLDII